MQTENVHSTARQMTQIATQVNAQLEVLQSAIQKLDLAWQGGKKSEAVILEMQNTLNHLKVQQDFLAQLAMRVEHEANEWEEVDQNGGKGLGQASGNLSLLQPSVSISIASFFTGLPIWLSLWLAKFFPEPIIVSPIIDEKLIPTPINNSTSSQPKSKLGELMDKAKKEQEEKEKLEKERLRNETRKTAETPKPKYISQYQAREDDGTYLVGQEKSDSCSIASTKMAIQRATGVDVNESDLRKESHAIDGGYENKTKWGTNPSSLDDLVNTKHSDIATASYNDPGTQTVTDLEKAASDGKGIVVSVKNSEWFGSENAHSVTVVGVTNKDGEQFILVNDPWPPGEGKRLSIPASDFEKAWWGDANYISKKVQE